MHMVSINLKKADMSDIKPKFYFQIITTSGVPIYRQIMDQVKTHVATGRLTAGEYLPSVRQVASEIQINPMTVSKAYSLLEKDGVIEFVRGQGMAISHSKAAHADNKERKDEITPLLKEVVTKARQLSLSSAAVREILERLFKETKDG